MEFHLFVLIGACFLLCSPYTPEQSVSPRWGVHVTRFDLNLSGYLWNPSIHSLFRCSSLSTWALAIFAWSRRLKYSTTFLSQPSASLFTPPELMDHRWGSGG